MKAFKICSFFAPVLSFPITSVLVRKPQQSFRRPTFATKSNNESMAQREILNELDAFQYEGRLPAGGDGHRCGFVCIVGAPNMGKSTIMNALLEEELCIATRKPQTTRHAILGIMSTDNTQVCLVDTPGVIENPSYKLQEGMMEAVMGAFHDADLLLVVTDLFSTPIPDDSLFRRVQMSEKPVVVVINKIDLANKVNKECEENNIEGRTVTVEQAIARWRSLLPTATAVLPVSAERGPDDTGINALRQILVGSEDVPATLRDLGRPMAGMFPPNRKTVSVDVAKSLLPFGPPLYGRDVLTDRPERFFCSELVRASLFQNLKKEVPYCCEVQIVEFKENHTKSGKTYINANVIVERDSQKSIVIGKHGATIKKVGIEAREKLEEFLQTEVRVELNVKVDKDWRKKENSLKRFGYVR
mmetsp:Transcript_3127/g.4626  ORF Transcript_3127/g.4626 Transcript_3127/m.4626 type:complete len:415 (-) Transcript_3127:1615-2859(-)